MSSGKAAGTSAPAARRDPYEVLSVSRDSSDQEIKTAYRKLALKVKLERRWQNGDLQEYKARQGRASQDTAMSHHLLARAQKARACLTKDASQSFNVAWPCPMGTTVLFNRSATRRGRASKARPCFLPEPRLLEAVPHRHSHVPYFPSRASRRPCQATRPCLTYRAAPVAGRAPPHGRVAELGFEGGL